MPLGHPRNRRLRYARRAGAMIILVAAFAAMLRFSMRHTVAEPRPVQSTSLEQTGLMKLVVGGAWRNLPFDIDPAEESDLIACLKLASNVLAMVDGESRFRADGVRQKLESLIAWRPNLFYAEYLLGLWHEMNGHAEPSRHHYARALERAPVTLVQRYELEDGTPLVGALVQSFEIECNRVKGHSLNPELKLRFHNLITDENGCIFLPVYDTVYRRSAASHPNGFDAEFPRVGWFEASGTSSLLPPAKVSRRPIR